MMWTHPKFIVLLLITMGLEGLKHTRKSTVAKIFVGDPSIKRSQLSMADIKHYIKREEVPKWKQELIEKYLHKYGWDKLVDMWRKHGFDKSKSLQTIQSVIQLLGTKRRLTDSFQSFLNYRNAAKALKTLTLAADKEKGSALNVTTPDKKGKIKNSQADKISGGRSANVSSENSKSSQLSASDGNTPIFRELQVGYKASPTPNNGRAYRNLSGILSFTTEKNVTVPSDSLITEKSMAGNDTFDFQAVDDEDIVEEVHDGYDVNVEVNNDADEESRKSASGHASNMHNSRNATLQPYSNKTRDNLKNFNVSSAGRQKFTKSQLNGSSDQNSNPLLTLKTSSANAETKLQLDNKQSKSNVHHLEDILPYSDSSSNSQKATEVANLSNSEAQVKNNTVNNSTNIDEDDDSGYEILSKFDRLLGRKKSRHVLKMVIEGLSKEVSATTRGIILPIGNQTHQGEAVNQASNASSDVLAFGNSTASHSNPMNIFTDSGAPKLGQGIAGSGKIDYELSNKYEPPPSESRNKTDSNNQTNATAQNGAGINKTAVEGNVLSASQNPNGTSELDPQGRTIGNSDLTKFIAKAREEYLKGNEGAIFSQHIFPLLGDALGQPGQTHKTAGPFPMQMAVQVPNIQGENMNIGRIDSSKMPYLVNVNEKPEVTPNTPQMPFTEPSDTPEAPDGTGPPPPKLLKPIVPPSGLSGAGAQNTGGLPFGPPSAGGPNFGGPKTASSATGPPGFANRPSQSQFGPSQSSVPITGNQPQTNAQAGGPGTNSEGLPVQVVQTGSPSAPSQTTHDAVSLNLPVMFINETSKEWNYTNPQDLRKPQSKYDIPDHPETEIANDPNIAIKIPQTNFSSEFGKPIPPQVKGREGFTSMSIPVNNTDYSQPNLATRGGPGFITDLASIGYIGFNKSLDGFKDAAKGIDSIKALAERVGIYNPKLAKDDDDDDEDDDDKGTKSESASAESEASAEAESGAKSKGKEKKKKKQSGSSSSSSSSSGSESSTEVSVSVGSSSESSSGTDSSTGSGVNVGIANNVSASTSVGENGKNKTTEGGKTDEGEKKPENGTESKGSSSSGSKSGSSSGSSSETSVEASVGSDTQTTSSTKVDSNSENKSSVGNDLQPEPTDAGKGNSGNELNTTAYAAVPPSSNSTLTGQTNQVLLENQTEHALSGGNSSTRRTSGFASDNSIFDIPDIANWLHSAITKERPKGSSEKIGSNLTSKLTGNQTEGLTLQPLNKTSENSTSQNKPVETNGSKKQVIVGLVPVSPGCSKEKSCLPDQYCRNSKCQNCNPSRHLCDGHETCCSGLQCIYGRCQNQPKGSLGSLCEKDGDCGGDACCVMEPTIGSNMSICKPRLAEFHQCSPILFRKVWINTEPQCGPCRQGLKCVQRGPYGNHLVCLKMD